MSTVTLRWIGDLEHDRRDQGGISSSSDRYRPRKIELKSGQKEIRIGRLNTKNPPDYPIESCINARMISRNHATIERLSKGGSMLYDHSMNGTYVNYTRVTGGVVLKHGDIVCFGHLNGANLKPGDQVSSFQSDLKYKVEIGDNSPTKESGTGGVKRKMGTSQPGSTVSSTQLSDGDGDASDDSAAIESTDTKRARLSGSGSASGGGKKPKKGNATSRRKVEEDEGDNSEIVNDSMDLASSKRGVAPSSKSTKKRANGTEKTKRAVHLTPTSAVRKSTATATPATKPGHHGHGKDKRGRVGRPGKANSHDDDEDDGNASADAGEMFHYDSEECSARPCKQPQDIAIDWIQCDRCALWYHQVCLGLKPSEANVDTYFCPACKK